MVVAATSQTRRRIPNADMLRHLNLWATARKPTVSRYQRRAEVPGELQVQRIHTPAAIQYQPTLRQSARLGRRRHPDGPPSPISQHA